MESVIAFIAGQHGLRKENLATEVLVYLLDVSTNEVVWEWLRSYGVGGEWQPHGYRFEPQRGLTLDRSIPDVKVKDSKEALCALIESKFSAQLTSHQPVDYLAELPIGGVLLFIAPEYRRCSLFNELFEKCDSSNRFQQVLLKKPEQATALVDDRLLVVTSWDDVLQRLADLQRKTLEDSPERQRRLADIEQLRRFCEVVERDTFEPLTAEQIRGTGISAVIHQLKWITDELIARCIERGIVQQKNDSPRKGSSGTLRAEADSSLYYGQELRFCEADIWIGFWGAAWEERKTTPLWIEISVRDPRGKEIAMQVQRVKGVDAVVRRPEGGWLIPIPISANCDQEQVVEEAVGFVSAIKGA